MYVAVPMQRILLALPLVALVACGPSARNGNGDDTTIDSGSGGGSSDSGPCTPTAEVCNDGLDNDCDGLADCSDPDCSGVGQCPICGQVNDPEATAIALPDGVSDGQVCSSDAQCSGATPNCIIAPHTNMGVLKECHASYTSTLDFIGFPMGATLTDTTKLLNVCIDIEHTYLHDLQIEVLSPPNASGVRFKVAVHEFGGRIGPKIYVGHPNENDDGAIVPGVTQHYCFVPSAPVTMFNAPFDQFTAPNGFGSEDHVPPGDYTPMEPFSQLQGAPLNGTWTMRVTDMFAIDNGTLAGWSITFDPSLVTSCTGPIIQ